jgi:hypothetical protein
MSPRSNLLVVSQIVEQRFTQIKEAIMAISTRARSIGTGAPSRKPMGLRLLALIASFSLMLIGFGAVAASPATADGDNGDGTHTPLCAPGYHFDRLTSTCVKKDLVEKTAPSVSYEGNCDFTKGTEAAEEDEDAQDQSKPKYGPYVFDIATGECTRTKISGHGPDRDTKDGNISKIIRTCEEGWDSKDSNGAVDAEHSSPPEVIYWCERTTTYEPQNPTCRTGDTLVPASVGTTHTNQNGARCYTPRRYCEFKDGQWIRTPNDAKSADGQDWYNGYCFYGYQSTYCQASPDGTSFVTATFYLKYGDDPGPPSTEQYSNDVFYTDPSGFADADIVPVIPNPSDSGDAFFAGKNLTDGGQAFLDRGCLPESAPAPGPGPAAATVVGPEIDYCPDVAGVQWEGYDCLTGQPAPVAVEAATAVAPATVPEAATVPAEEPTPLTAPEAATIPAAVPAGGGSSAPSLPVWAFALIIAGTLGMAVSGKRVAGSHLR